MADIRISQLPTAPTAITGTELVPIVQNGLTVQTTVSAITQSPTQTQTFLTVGQQTTLPNSRYFSTGTGLGITDGGAQGAYSIALNGTSGSLEGAGTGVIVKSAANTIVARSLAVSGNGISVANGSGVSGNPTFQLTGLALALANASGTGLLALGSGTTLSPVTLTGTSNQIGVTGGDGSATPTISLANNFVAPGTAGITLPNGTTAQRGATTGQIRYNTTTARFEGYYVGSWQTFGIGDGTVTSVSGTANQIDVNNVGSIATVAIAANPIVPGNGGFVVPIGTTAQRNPSPTNGTLRYNSSLALFEGYANSAWGAITTGSGVTSIATGTGLTGGPITTTGTISIANTAVTAAAYGSATAVGTFTVNAQGQLTLAGNTTITPAVGSITGLGTGVATALGVNVGSAGAFVVNGGALGTPSSGTVTNLTGTASININGTVGATTASTGDFTTLNSSGATRLGGLSGNQSLQVNNVASAVNYLQANGSAASSWPIFSSQGSDTNIGMVFASKGTGGFTFASAAGAAWFYVNQAASAVNYLSVNPAATGVAPNLQAIGSDANVAMTFATKGTFGYGFYTNSFAQQQFSIAHTASAVNYPQVSGSATGVGSPSLQVQGSDTNITMSYYTKGTGTHNFSANNALQFLIGNTASAVNYLQVAGAATGDATTISAAGSDSDVGLNFTMKGWNSIKFNSSTGGQLFQIGQVTSVTANFFQALGNSTGNAPIFSAQGSDANIGLVLNSKGTGVVALGGSTVANSSLQVIPVTSSANYLTIAGSASGVFATTIGSNGTDGSVNINYSTKTSGSHVFGTNSGSATQAAITHTASSVNYVNLTGSATNGGVPANAAPVISAQGSDTNIGLVLTGKGSGVVALGGSTVANSGFAVNTPSGTIDAINIFGSAGSNPYFAAVGTSAIINLAFYSKGISSTTFGRSGGSQNFSIASVASSVNYLQVVPAVTNSTPYFAAVGSDADISLSLIPKGTGSVTINATTAITVPAGTTAQRPTGATGMFRYNSTTAGFEGYNGTVWGAIGGGSNITTLGLYENANTISANYTIGTSNNAVSAGPITINSGVVVTVPSGSTWVVI